MQVWIDRIALRAPVVAMGLAAALAMVCTPAAVARSPQPWADTSLTPDRRAALVVAEMTLDEKLSLLHGDFPRMLKPIPSGMPSVAGYIPGVPRLALPPLIESDASLGVANAGRAHDDAAALPSSLALAATWSGEAAYAGGAMIGKETRQKGFGILLAGGVNLVRDPRNGRNFEYVGEDPLLAGTIAGQAIKGIQSNHIVSTTKHFVLNAQETGRHVLNAVIDPAALRESDLLAFELAIEIGQPGSVMCAYNKVNGAYACENQPIFAALKQDWGWKGWVMSDWGAVHSTEAALTGLDQQSGQQLDNGPFFGEGLRKAVADGRVSQARIDDMAHRILWGLFATGLLDNPVQAGGLDVVADTRIAARTAEQGIVLLKNRGGLLPLIASARRIAVIGGHADVGVISGGGSSQVIPIDSKTFPAPKWAPSWGQGAVYHPSSPLQAIRKRAAGAQVSFDAGTNPATAAAAAKRADLAIVFATQWASEGVDVSMTLPDDQDGVIAAVAAANPNTIVVLETGGPVVMPWLSSAGAVLEAWYPGGGGGEAIARVLYGEIDASGRLPVTFPASEAQLPRPKLPGGGVQQPEGPSPGGGAGFDVVYHEGSDIGYRWFEKTGAKPLFPFGYGMSYSSFRYANLKLEGGDGLTVSFDVVNTGKRAGVDTPQVYAKPPGRTGRLIGWSKLTLAPGETRRVTVKADPRLLAGFDTAGHRWRRDAGSYAVVVGKAAGDVQLGGQVDVAARTLAP